MWRTLASICACAAALAAGSSVQGQTTWVACRDNPVLARGEQGDWDEFTVIWPCVIWDEQQNVFKMWYSGDEVNPYSHKIFYAESEDGVSWTKYWSGSGRAPTIVLDVGAYTDWDGHWVCACCVIKDIEAPAAERYKMWFTGGEGGAYVWEYQIGYATSPNGLVWTKYDDPSTANAPYAASDPVVRRDWWQNCWRGVMTPHVLKEAGIYKMWFSLGPWPYPTINYAESTDGINVVIIPDLVGHFPASLLGRQRRSGHDFGRGCENPP